MRITAGKYKNKQIKTVKTLDVRPTSSKVRESIFNILQDRVSESLMLDLFAGSGIMGLEALSRGAEKVVFVEKNLKTARLLKQNVSFLTKSVDIIIGDALKALEKLNGRNFDIIFLDPPYAINIIPEVLQKIKTLNLLKPEGIIIIEHSSNIEYSKEIKNLNFTLIKNKIYGDTALSFIE